MIVVLFFQIAEANIVEAKYLKDQTTQKTVGPVNENLVYNSLDNTTTDDISMTSDDLEFPIKSFTGTFLRSVDSCETPFEHDVEAEADADAHAQTACWGIATRVSTFTFYRSCGIKPYSDTMIARIDARATYKCIGNL